MSSIVSGSNLVTSVREFDQITPPTQHQALVASVQNTEKVVQKAKTDSITISKEALAMAKRGEKATSLKRLIKRRNLSYPDRVPEGNSPNYQFLDLTN